MSKEVVKVFTDVTNAELTRLLGRIKRAGKKMQSSCVEMEEYTLTDDELFQKLHSEEGLMKIDNYKKYRNRFKSQKVFNKVIWRYVL